MLYMTDQIIKSDPFWLNDFTILIEKNRLIEFFPTEDMSINEKLNAITRLMFYISLVLNKRFQMLSCTGYGCCCICILKLLYLLRFPHLL